MGQEFCKGCEDYTNFKNNEGNLSYFSNKPIHNLNNPFFDNGHLDNSFLNKTDFQNDTSFLTSCNINFNNQNKNEISRISSIKSKRINNDNVPNFFNKNYNQKESEDILRKNNENKGKNNENISNNSHTNQEEIKNIKNNLNEDDEKLNKIKKNYKAKIITQFFKQAMEKRMNLIKFYIQNMAL